MTESDDRTIGELYRRLDGMERSLEAIRHKLDNNTFLRTGIFEEFRRGFDGWRESQDRTNVEMKDWQNKMNWSLIGILMGLAGEGLFILLTRP